MTLKLKTLENVLPVPGYDFMLVVPLGGTERVGMNCTLVGYAGRWIMIDAGATFPGADSERAVELEGVHDGSVEQIIPDFRTIASLAPRIDGLVITHSHEDHIGALPAFYQFRKAWPLLASIPLYAGVYARGIIGKKLEEYDVNPKVRVIASRRESKIGPFTVTPIRVTHSAPETFMLAISTPVGTIVFGSDTKLDTQPLLGGGTDTRMLCDIGKQGVLAYFGDSTNASRDGRSVTEGDVAKGIEAVMRRSTGKVVVSTFASNLARVVAVNQAARNSGRSLAAFGRTILNNLDVATGVGLLPKGAVPLVEPRFIRDIPDRNMAIVCTGTQGEQGAALMRALEDLELGRRGRGLSLSPGDIVIHSARTIPGNEETVNAMLGGLESFGITVYRPDDIPETIHASGHARRGELTDFYRMLKPKFAVPVHGDRFLIDAHLDLARSQPSVEKAFSPMEGDVLSIGPGGMNRVSTLSVGQLAVLAIGGRFSGENKLVDWDNAAPMNMMENLTKGSSRPAPEVVWKRRSAPVSVPSPMR